MWFSISASKRNGSGLVHAEPNFERDAVGRVLSQTVAGTNTTSFAWDENTNLVGVTPPAKPEHSQTFTPVNLLGTYTPPVLGEVPQPATSFFFNLDRQPTVTQRPDGFSFERVYDNAGKLDSIDTPSGIIDYSYFDLTPCVGCAPGSLAAIAHPSGVNLAYTYDGHLVTSTTWSGGVNGGIQRSYNNDFRVVTETVNTASATTPISFAYDDDGLKSVPRRPRVPRGPAR